MSGGVYYPEERLLDWDETDDEMLKANQATMFTALPVQINKNIPEKNTVEAQPTIQLNVVNNQKGTTEWKSIPATDDMPLLHLGGGGMAITIPVAQGDEGLAIYASRSIDNWWTKGG